MRLRQIVAVLLFFLFAAVTASAQQKIDLEDVVRADGSLMLPDRFQGTIDTRGFVLSHSPDGAPRFSRAMQPPAPVDPGDEHWDDRFGDVAPDRADPGTILVDGSDIYIAGNFSIVGEVPAAGIARWDGSRWHALGKGVDGEIFTMLFMGDDLIVGGSLARAGDLQVNGIARWDGTAWHALGPQSTNGVAGTVYSMAAVGDDLYVGGSFSQSGDHFGPEGILLYNIGRWNRATNTWYPLVENGRTGTNSHVAEVAIDNGRLYAAGSFDTAGVTPARRIAVWEIATQEWNALGGGFAGSVNTMQVAPGAVYIGGAFDTVGSDLDVAVAKWDIAQGRWSGLRGDTLLDGTLYFVPDMILRNGAPVAVAIVSSDLPPGYESHLVEWDGSRWRRIDSGLPGNPLQILPTAGDGLLVLGDYRSSAPGDARAWLATRNGAGSWNVVPLRLRGGAYTSVDAVAVMGDDIYLAGSIYNVGDLEASNFVRWNRATNTWHLLDGDSAELAERGFIRDLAVLGDRLVAAGMFITDDFDFLDAVMIWDPAARRWSLAGIANNTISSLTTYGGRVYVGGSFDTLAGVPAKGAAILNPDGRWESLGFESIEILTDAYISLITPYENGVYLYGTFNSLIGTITGVVRWSGGQYEILTSEVDGTVSSMALVGNDLYIGGEFGMVENVEARNLARYNAGTWQAVGEESRNGVNGPVATLLARGSELLVGGRFDSAGGAPAHNIVRWNGESWHTLGSGTNNEVLSMALDASSLYLGGRFSYAGGKPSLHFARWSGPLSRAPEMPRGLSGATLSRIHPNPVRSSTSIEIELARFTQVTLDIVDARGAHVATLHRGALAAGRHEIGWNVEGIPSGDYFVKLDTPEGIVSRRIMVVR